VITFGGYASGQDLLDYRRRLVEAFEAEIDVASEAKVSLFQVWSYDPWWKFWHRRNELHMFLDNDIDFFF
jgi:hypothetical protein